MITINNRTLCENCFAEISSDPCPLCGFNPRLHKNDPIALRLGSILNKRYRIGGVIGKGGFGITYLAYDLKLDTRIAVKEYYPLGLAIRTPGNTTVSVSNEDSEKSFRSGAEKFYNEARTVARFNGNINIVSVHDFFYENDTVYFTMGYLEGETLKSYLKHSKLTEGQAVGVMQDISNALMAVHSMNILHRDISPDNIMLCNDGTIKLLDFGAARQVMAEQSQSLSVILKQGFAPLEQYQKRGRQGPWTDIYALGATVFNALTGELPDDPMTRFEDDTRLMGTDHGITEELWNVLKKCMMLKIDDRYQDVFELKRDLKSVSVEAEPIIEKVTETELPSSVETAKVFDSRAYEEDPNATRLLQGGANPTTGEDRTVLIEHKSGPIPEPPVQAVHEEVRNQPVTKDQKKSGGPVIPIICAAVVLVLIIAVIAAALLKHGSRKTVDQDVLDAMEIETLESSSEEETTSEEVTEEATAAVIDEVTEDEITADSDGLFSGDTEEASEPGQADETEVTAASSGENDNEEFGLDGSESPSYQAVIYDYEYGRYDSGKGRFSFTYPRYLYSSVVKEDGSMNGMDFEDVTFTRSDGSWLYYSTREYSGVSVEEEMDYLYRNLADTLVEIEEIIPRKIDEGDGIFILTGREKENYDNLVYLLVRVGPGRLYEMEIVFPDYESDEDKEWKGFYAEYLYRSCGFTNSSRPVRTFDEYESEQ